MNEADAPLGASWEPYPAVRMISWRRYGYRMIGTCAIGLTAGDRAALARARYMGAPAPALNLTPANYRAPGTTSFQGETTVVTAPPPPPPAPAPAPPRRVLALHLGPTATQPAPAPVPVTIAPVRVLAASPMRAAAAPDCPTCEKCTSPLVAGGAGLALGALLMYVVGLATREQKKKKGRR